MNKKEKEYWENYIKWTLEDIDLCMNNHAYLAAAKLICLAIDSLGSFYVGRGYKGNEKCTRPKGGSGLSQQEPCGPKKAFVAFVSNYMPQFKDSVVIIGEKQKNGANFLHDHFRNGLVHEGLPDAGVAIIDDDDNAKLFPKGKKFILAINIKPFWKVFKLALEKYNADISDPNQPERLSRWHDRYNYLQTFNVHSFFNN